MELSMQVQYDGGWGRGREAGRMKARRRLVISSGVSQSDQMQMPEV